MAERGGYALELNPHKLKPLVDAAYEKEGVSALSLKAEYVDAEVPEALKDRYVTIGKIAQDMIVDDLEKTKKAGLGGLASPFMTAASVVKDPYFKGEGEARLVAMRFKKNSTDKLPPRVFVRQVEAGTVPYIKLFENSLLGEGSPIEAIIVGPQQDRARKADALSIYLEGRDLGQIQVIESNVPYLGS